MFSLICEMLCNEIRHLTWTEILFLAWYDCLMADFSTVKCLNYYSIIYNPTTSWLVEFCVTILAFKTKSLSGPNPFIQVWE